MLEMITHPIVLILLVMCVITFGALYFSHLKFEKSFSFVMHEESFIPETVVEAFKEMHPELAEHQVKEVMEHARLFVMLHLQPGSIGNMLTVPSVLLEDLLFLMEDTKELKELLEEPSTTYTLFKQRHKPSALITTGLATTYQLCKKLSTYKKIDGNLFEKLLGLDQRITPGKGIKHSELTLAKVKAKVKELETLAEIREGGGCYS